MKRIVLIIVPIVFLSSCIVSKKKYDDLLAQKVSMEADLSDRSSQLDKETAQRKELEELLKKMKEDTTNLGIGVRSSSKK